MKTVKELYGEIRADENLRKRFADAVKKGEVEDFLTENGCGASLEDLADFIQTRQESSEKSVEMLSLEELENVVGGFPDISLCLESCFLEGHFVSWLHDYCPKCAAYIESKL